MGAQHLGHTAEDYDRLPATDRDAIREWLNRVLPDRWIFAGDLVDEGTIAFDTIRRPTSPLSTNDLGLYRRCATDIPNHQPDIAVVATRIHITDPPPEQLLRFLLADQLESVDR